MHEGVELGEIGDDVEKQPDDISTATPEKKKKRKHVDMTPEKLEDKVYVFAVM